MSEQLTDKQERFCHEYVVDFNATQAAIRAGYAEKGAHVRGSQLLSHGKVQARVKELTQKVNDRTLIDAEWVLRRLAMMATADVTQILDELGNPLDPKDWPEDVKTVIAGFDVQMLMDSQGQKGGMLVQKIKRVDPLRTLELLGRHKAIQAFKDNVEVDAGANLVEAILAGRKRARSEQ